MKQNKNVMLGIISYERYYYIDRATLALFSGTPDVTATLPNPKTGAKLFSHTLLFIDS